MYADPCFLSIKSLFLRQIHRNLDINCFYLMKSFIFHQNNHCIFFLNHKNSVSKIVDVSLDNLLSFTIFSIFFFTGPSLNSGKRVLFNKIHLIHSTSSSNVISHSHRLVFIKSEVILSSKS